jgi:hypothetical protein
VKTARTLRTNPLRSNRSPISSHSPQVLDQTLAAPEVERPRWLLLVHQIPPEPAYLRVKIRRRLRRIGAVALKSTVYVLPTSDSAREAFEWLAQEVRSTGGEAILCEANFISGMRDDDVRDLFRQEREAEYAEIVSELKEVGRVMIGSGVVQWAHLARARRRFAGVSNLDFFHASGRADAERAMADAEARLSMTEATRNPVSFLDTLRGKVWVTRRGVHVDRMASAWLIRRFIDPGATFRFVDPDLYQPEANQVRFDMYEAEFTHEMDRCTFEVLSGLVSSSDAALKALGEIVHDIDLDDGKFARVESAGIARLILGIQAAHSNDTDRIVHGLELFESLYRSFGGTADYNS